MFTPREKRGNHTVLQFEPSTYPFREFFQTLYSTSDLTDLHTTSSTYSMVVSGDVSDISDYESDLHKKFYQAIKSDPTFKTLYCRLVQDIHTALFPEESILLYQSFPSVRFQFPLNVAVPPHCDSDSLGKHPLGEKNFLLPVTSMHRSQRLFIESEPGLGDFSGVDLDYGDLFYFNGNKCIHFNEKNVEGSLRISLDFRVLTQADYNQYITGGPLTTTNPRDPERLRAPTRMVGGGYYQMTRRGETLESMMNWHFQKDMILQSRPHFGPEEAEATYRYMSNPDNYLTEYKQTEELERMLCEYIGTKHCIMTTSGNNAIVMALMALDLKPTDEVIVPNYTMIATINSVRMVGAKPVLVDVDPLTLTLSLDTVRRVRTPHTKVVLHVSLNNRSQDLTEMRAYCDAEGLLLVEDAAQSLGCRIGGKHLGTFGSLGCFSLSTPKIISTGQGGFVVTDNSELARKMRMIKNFGRKEGGVDVFEVFGLNMKFTDVQAVIGIEQVKKLPTRVKRLRAIFDRYAAGLPGRFRKPPSDEWIPWFVDLFVEDRDGLATFLKKHNIQTRPTYPEINRTPMYEDGQVFPVSESISRTGLFLPTHPLLTDAEIDYICKIISLY